MFPRRRSSQTRCRPGRAETPPSLCHRSASSAGLLRTGRVMAPTLRVAEHGNAEARGRQAASYKCLLVPLALDRMPGVLAGSGVPYVEGVVAAGEVYSQPVPGLEPVTGVPE